jgi:tRNA(fMet)-specific endonuclease VapC
VLNVDGDTPMAKVLLDTDIFSEILKGRNREVLQHANAHCETAGTYAISAITVLEIVKGLRKARREDRIQAVLTQIESLEVLSLDWPAGELAGRILGDLEQAGETIGFADSIIAAIALRHDLTLVTGNVSHYERIAKLDYPLRLDNWRTALSEP